MELRVTDFETVRKAFESEYGPAGPNGIGPPWTDEIGPALDRIEAEVERLRAALEECERDWKDTARATLRKKV